MLRTLSLLLISFFAALLLHFILITHLIIPDPSYYHTNEAGAFVEFFYDFPASEGYDPVWNSWYWGLIGVTAIPIYLRLRVRRKSSITNKIQN